MRAVAVAILLFAIPSCYALDDVDREEALEKARQSSRRTPQQMYEASIKNLDAWTEQWLFYPCTEKTPRGQRCGMLIDEELTDESARDFTRDVCQSFDANEVTPECSKAFRDRFMVKLQKRYQKANKQAMERMCVHDKRCARLDSLEALWMESHNNNVLLEARAAESTYLAKLQRAQEVERAAAARRAEEAETRQRMAAAFNAFAQSMSRLQTNNVAFVAQRCSMDAACPYSQRCVKQVNQAFGVCSTLVDANGVEIH